MEDLTSAFVSEVWEEDVLLREDEQSQPASCQSVVIHCPWVGQNLSALINHHPAGQHNKKKKKHVIMWHYTNDLKTYILVLLLRARSHFLWLRM